MTAAAIWSGVCEGRTPMLPWAKYEGTYGNSDGFDTRISLKAPANDHGQYFEQS